MLWLNKFKEHWQYRLLSLFLAFFCWYLVSGSEKVDTWIEIPLEFSDLPDDYVIRSGMRNRIQVRVRGASGIIRGLDSQHLAYKAKLSSLRLGTNTILLNQKNIPLNTSLEVIEISPPRLELNVDKIVSKTLPVKVVWHGEVPNDLVLKETWARPETITLTGASAVLSEMEEVPTKEVELPGEVPRIWQTAIGLDIHEELETEVADVTAFFRLGPKTRTLWVKRPVTVVAPEGFDLIVDPAFVRLKLELPLSLLRQEDWRETINPQVGPDSITTTGSYEQTYKIILPEDTILLEANPVNLAITVEKKQTRENK
ncbi:CdaR family protein [Desulfoplanes sp. PS50]